MRLLRAALLPAALIIAPALVPGLASVPSSASAEEAGQPGAAQTVDAAPLQGVIRGQLEAFKRDDGDAAYSYAAPNIRQIFTTPETFMGMVKAGYPPVYRPRSYSFGPLKQQDGRWVQTVEIVGPDGDYWTAAYTMVQQADGSWKIAACVVIKAPGSSV